LTREYPAHPLVGASVVIRKKNSVLLVKRANEPGRGLWGVPGGLVNVGEKVYDAALREVREETGLTVKLEGILDVVDYISRDSENKVQYHYVIVDFLGHQISGRLKASSDTLDARWVYMKDLKNYKTTRTLRNLFKRKRLI
jgi:8-oxo-dGTP diphosphatase